jgi:hypothetical protein
VLPRKTDTLIHLQLFLPTASQNHHSVMISGNYLHFGRNTRAEVILPMPDFPCQPFFPHSSPQILIDSGDALLPNRGLGVVRHEWSDEGVEVVPFICDLASIQ